MSTDPVTPINPSAPAAPAAAAPSSAVPEPVAANPQPSLLGAELPKAADSAVAPVAARPAPAPSPESAARLEAFSRALSDQNSGRDAKLAAWNALNADEKATTFKGLAPEIARELGLEDPAIPHYTSFKLPDGVTVDSQAMGEATDLFKGARLNQEQAQKFIDLAVSREQAAARKGVQAFIDIQNKWAGEIRSDPEVGGERLHANLAAAARLIDRLNIPGLREALNLTGAGNHPAVFKAFARLGQMVTEDRFAPGAEAAPSSPTSLAERLYGSGGPKGSTDGM